MMTNSMRSSCFEILSARTADTSRSSIFGFLDLDLRPISTAVPPPSRRPPSDGTALSSSPPRPYAGANAASGGEGGRHRDGVAARGWGMAGAGGGVRVHTPRADPQFCPAATHLPEPAVRTGGDPAGRRP